MKTIELTIIQKSVFIKDVLVTDEQFAKLMEDDFDPDYDWDAVDKYSELETDFDVKLMNPNPIIEDRPSNRIDWYLNNFKTKDNEEN